MPRIRPDGLRMWAKEKRACDLPRHQAGDATHGVRRLTKQKKCHRRSRLRAGTKARKTAGTGGCSAQETKLGQLEGTLRRRGRHHRPDRQGAGLAAAQCARRELRLLEEEAGPHESWPRRSCRRGAGRSDLPAHRSADAIRSPEGTLEAEDRPLWDGLGLQELRQGAAPAPADRRPGTSARS